jgi:hypothetical protein
MPAYQERFAVGAPVQIASREALDTFQREWTFHNPLTAEQLAFAGHQAIVTKVGYYHGGDPLYCLRDVPGVWHEACLSSPSTHAV